jgi:hypothetical protein
MTASGTAPPLFDTIRFTVSGVPGQKPGLIIRADNQVTHPAGDGILCTSGQSQRSQVQFTNAGITVITSYSGGPFFSVSNQLGVPSNFQFWYRDAANTCSGRGVNFSNAVELVYAL